ncbi:hypothetical protein [Stieleria mannarensis]|uniref:hypothetical protein n=1 Tax=Stieleria mannarensis TaxID=2755585 RepID=UPI0016010755|nr:hypothetical protein [Rhodopirellula sp. JC639]
MIDVMMPARSVSKGRGGVAVKIGPLRSGETDLPRQASVAEESASWRVSWSKDYVVKKWSGKRTEAAWERFFAPNFLPPIFCPQFFAPHFLTTPFFDHPIF